MEVLSIIAEDFIWKPRARPRTWVRGQGQGQR